MNPFEFVIGVVAIVFGIVFVSRHLNRGDAAAPAAPSETQLLHDEVRNLRDRIQVLERVITDNHKSVDLVSEIERLRDR